MVLAILIVMGPVAAAEAETAAGEYPLLSPVRLTSLLQPLLTQDRQPFAGEIRFSASPQIDQVCSVLVDLTSQVHLDTVQQFRLASLHSNKMVIAPDTVSWEAPIDSGEAFAAVFTFVPSEVGTYQFVCRRKAKQGWQNLAMLALAFDEDGRALYGGDALNNRFTLVPPHPRSSQDTVILNFPLRNEGGDPRYDRHFTAQFRMHPAPALKETTLVEFDLECHVGLYRDVQFILEHSTNLKPSELPESWGNRAGPVEGFRHYHGSFWFVPLTWGFGVVNLKVVGLRPIVRQSERLTTEFPIYLVLGEDGLLKYIGYSDPWERYNDPADPMLGSLAELVDIQRRSYRVRHVLSQPDFIGSAMKAANDSLKQADSLQQKEPN